MAVVTLKDGSRIEVDAHGNASLLSGSCKCESSHRPRIRSFDVHHIVPQSWGGKSTVENMAVVCPNTHRMTHLLLNEYVRAKGVPSPSVLVKFGHRAQDLAALAWRNHDHDTPTPMTVDHGS